MYSGGSGTIGDPYLIATPQDLHDIRSNLSAYFKLTQDIDLDGTAYDPWTPIGTESVPFRGHIDGDGKVINGLYVSSASSFQGFIGYGRYGFSVSKLGFTNAHLYFTSIGERGWGIIAGVAGNSTESPFSITECYVSGVINSFRDPDVANFNEVGGLIGLAFGDSTGTRCKIENCWSNVEITATEVIGGIVGTLSEEIDLSNCHADGNITGAPNIFSVCGIVGGLSFSLNSEPDVRNCSSNMNSLTRFSGSGTNFYRIGSNLNFLTNNYANSAMTLPVTPTSDANGRDGLDKTLAELKQRTTYQTGLGWDFSDIWYIRENKGFPLLRAFRAVASALFFGTNF